MTRVYQKRSKKAGLPPGTLVHDGEKKVGDVHISVIEYSPDGHREQSPVTLEEVLQPPPLSHVRWINVDGLHQVEVVEKLGKEYRIHPLVQEDILQTAQRPKFEEHDGYAFIVIKMLSYQGRSRSIEAEQLSLVFGPNYMLSFQEAPGDIFEGIRNSIRAQMGSFTQHGADYLAYALLDAVVDHYFVILEALGDRSEELEDELLKNSSRTTLHEIYKLKRELILTRKSTWPLREVVNQMMRVESGLIQKNTQVYLRDPYDHVIAIIDTIENLREMMAVMLDIYLSSVSNKMNEVMKILTIIATIFIPLTFIVGIYGMNFDAAVSPWNMPELHWYWGYPSIMVFMGMIALLLVIYFKKKDWL